MKEKPKKAFLYYVPDKDKAAQAEVRGVLGIPNVDGGEISGGPDGHNGIVLARSKTVKRCGYFSDTQTWVKAPGRIWWIGWEGAEKPGPEDLERDVQLSGYRATLQDGKGWLVPIARAFGNNEATLPRRLTLQEDGTWGQTILEEFQSLYERAEAISALYYREEVVIEPSADNMALMIDALAVNYHIGPVEVSLLGLLTTENLRLSLGYLVDWPDYLTVMLERSAKNVDAATGDGNSTSDGGPD